MKKKRSNMVLISMVLTAAYLIYSIVYWGKASSAGAESAEQVGGRVSDDACFSASFANGIWIYL